MKQFVIAGTLAGALAVGGTALAQQPPAPAPKTAPAPKAKRPSKTQDLLKELGLASSGDLLKDLGLK